MPGPSTLDRIATIQRTAIPDRLIRGAEILGKLWRAGVRCAGGGWSGLCGCTESETDFCRAKSKWLGLLRELHPSVDELSLDAPWSLAEIMMVTDGDLWASTGLDALVTVPDGRAPIRVGPRGTSLRTVFDLAAIPAGSARLAALAAVERIQGVFGGA